MDVKRFFLVSCGVFLLASAYSLWAATVRAQETRTTFAPGDIETEFVLDRVNRLWADRVFLLRHLDRMQPIDRDKYLSTVDEVMKAQLEIQRAAMLEFAKQRPVARLDVTLRMRQEAWEKTFAEMKERDDPWNSF